MSYLAHHGVKGQKWGVIRNQQPNPAANPVQNYQQTPQNTPKKKYVDKDSFAYKAKSAGQDIIIGVAKNLIMRLLIAEGTKVMQLGAKASENAYKKRLREVNPEKYERLAKLAKEAGVKSTINM